MDRHLGTLLGVVIGCSACCAQTAERQELIRQVEAEDALAKVLERSAPAGSDVVRDVEHRLAYDQALKAAVGTLPRDADEAPDLADLSSYQLRQAVSLLHMHNLELYVATDARAPSSEATKAFVSEQSVRDELAKAPPTTQPTRSSLLAKYLKPPVILERTTMDNLDASAQRHAEIEAQEPQQMTPDQLLAAVLSGRQLNRAFAVPSTIAPTDARMPGSRMLNEVSPRTLPLPADVAGTVALRADPPGNPSDVVPKPEDVSRLVNALGVTPDVAARLATGQITLAEAMQQGGASGQQSELTGGLVPNDPRWSNGYYGVATGFRNWQIMSLDAFQFYPGGGRYVRSDQRINNSPDMRTNSEPDRRINISNDRRTNVQIDPRVNY